MTSRFVSNPLAENYRLVQERIALAARASARDPEEVRLLAVSKKQTAEKIRHLYALGQRDFGENYVQELAQKAEELADLPELRFHLIGHLQTNKVKALVPFIHAIHSVDSRRLVQELEKRALDRRAPDKAPIECWIEVKLSDEASKAGALREHVPDLIQAINACSRLRFAGLMTLPELDASPARVSQVFGALALLAKELRPSVSDAVELSMGMSQDLELAIAQGSHCVRVGTALFGQRPTSS